MRITGLTLYQAELHYAGKAYAFSQGRSYSSFLTSVVAVETDAGLTGYGEACPCGPAYAPAYAEGVLPALQLLAPGVLGRDPRETTAMLRAMERALNGHDFAKTAIDLACWDLLGKSSGQPVYRLLGGRLVEAIPLHRVVPLGETPEETLANVDALRDRGFRHFQVKLGQGVEADVTTWQPARSFDWWHDRAVFHFQTPPESQHAYLATLERALAPTGHAVLATFADDGPEQCSGLATMRFDEATLTATVSPVLEPIRFVRETHTTPSGAAQSFLYGLFRRPNPEPSPKEP